MKNVIKTKMDNLIVMVNRNQNSFPSIQLCTLLNDQTSFFDETSKSGCTAISCSGCVFTTLERAEKTANILLKITDLME